MHIYSKPGLHSEFHDSQDYLERSHLNNYIY